MMQFSRQAIPRFNYTSAEEVFALVSTTMISGEFVQMASGAVIRADNPGTLGGFPILKL